MFLLMVFHQNFFTGLDEYLRPHLLHSAFMSEPRREREEDLGPDTNVADQPQDACIGSQQDHPF